MVIGLPLVPEPCVTRYPELPAGAVNVPQRWTVVPGPILVPLGAPDVQLPEVLKYP